MKWDVMLYLILTLYLSLANLCSAFVETRGCNRTVRNSVGWIRWTGRMGRCIVRIRAPLRDPQVIELRIRRLQVGVLKNGHCEGAYIQLSNDIEDLHEDVGRYCGHVTSNSTRLFLRKGPDLTIIMDSETRFAAENPVIFSAQFSILPAQLASERHHNPSSSASDCSLECTQRTDRRTCRLMSPGYPGVYPRGMRCRVALESNVGRFRIGGDPEDLYNLMNYTHQDSCSTENCEAHVEHNRGKLSHTDVLNRSSRSLTDRTSDEDEIIISQDIIRSQRSKIKKHRRKSKALRQKVSYAAKIPFLPESYQRNGTLGKGDTLSRDHLNRFRHNGHHSHEKQAFLLTNKDDADKPQSKEVDDNDFGNTQKNHEKSSLSIFEPRFLRRYRLHDKLGNSNCVGDYLALLENVGGRVLEISKFCGEGRIPQILSRSKNVIVEFYAERDGTIMHDGFQLTLQEIEEKGPSHEKNCEFIYRSSGRSRENVKSLRSWYPPNTLCSYRFFGKATERVSVQLKIVRDEIHNDSEELFRKNSSLNYCPGNEIAIYNGAHANSSLLVWSYCDASHYDINNIQVPIVSTGNTLLIQYYSAKGSFDGQEFTYTISYKFVRKAQDMTKRRQVNAEETKIISLRPVNFSALNLSDSENCNCDISGRIGSFKSWFMVLVVLGIISFIGAVFTIVALLAKCMKMRSVENKLLQTPKR